MSKWQPIETAPKDGTKVLLASSGRMREVHGIGWYRSTADEGWVYLDAGLTIEEGHIEEGHLNGWIPGHGPTHWMPLPKPPNA